jgi:hypothetical protein
MDLKHPIRLLCTAALAVALVPAAAFAQRGDAPVRRGPGTGNPDVQLVPWKYLQSDVLVHDAPVTLYWLPANAGQVTQSPLFDSKPLVTAATRCVGFEIVMPERATVLHNLGETGKVPAVLVLDRDGRTLRKFENPNGELLTKDVEKLLTSELDARDQAMFRSMMAASQEATAGRNQNAINIYKKIWDDRCLYPLAANEAKRSLAQLGVNVQEPPKTTATTTAK